MIRDLKIKINNDRAGEIKTTLKKNKLIINLWDVLQHYSHNEIVWGMPIKLEVSCND